MKISGKIYSALVIDSIVWGILVFLALIPDMLFAFYDPVLFGMILIPLTVYWTVFNSLIFKNATIGMKVIGLEIVDVEGNPPKPHILIYRSLNSFALALEWKRRWLEKEDLYFWGLSSFGTHIVFSGDKSADVKKRDHLPPRTSKKKRFSLISPNTQRSSFYVPIIGTVLCCVASLIIPIFYIVKPFNHVAMATESFWRDGLPLLALILSMLLHFLICRFVTEILFVKASKCTSKEQQANHKST